MDELDWDKIIRNKSFPWSFKLLSKYNYMLPKRNVFSSDMGFIRPWEYPVIWRKAIAPYLDDELVEELFANIHK